MIALTSLSSPLERRLNKSPKYSLALTIKTSSQLLTSQIFSLRNPVKIGAFCKNLDIEIGQEGSSNQAVGSIDNRFGGMYKFDQQALFHKWSGQGLKG